MTDKRKKLTRALAARTGIPYQAAHNRLHRASGRFIALAERVITLAEARCKEEEMRHGGDDLVAWVGRASLPERPAERALNELLRATSHLDARKLEILMYAGRDELTGEPFKDAAELVNFDRQIALETYALTVACVSGKLPLPDYLKAGLELARRVGLDVEAEFVRPAL